MFRFVFQKHGRFAQFWAIGLVASSLLVSGSALAQSEFAVLGDLDTPNGSFAEGWFGYRGDDVHVVSHTGAPTQNMTLTFSQSDRYRRFDVDLQLIASDSSSYIGLFCCDDDSSPLWTLALHQVGDGYGISIVRIGDGDPKVEATWDRTTMENWNDIVSPDGRATLSIAEVENGMELYIAGNFMATISQPSLHPGKAGVIVNGDGVFAIHDFVGLFVGEKSIGDSDPPMTNTMSIGAAAE